MRDSNTIRDVSATDAVREDGGERRRRLRRPASLTVFGALFLGLPLLNYVSIAYRLSIPLTHVTLIFANLNALEIILLLGALPVGAGLLLVKKWGWWSFLAYSLILIAYNGFVFLTKPFGENLGALLLTIVGCVAMGWFMRRDISAPYLKLYPRGWRMQRRRPLVFEIEVDGIVRRTKDAGQRGVYVDWPHCRQNPGDAVDVAFRLNNNQYRLTGGVVRVDEDGAGIAFRDLDASTARRLSRDLQNQG